MPESTILLFGDCVLDESRRQLHRGGELIQVGPQVLALIVALIRHRDRVLTRRELQRAVWPDHTPSATALNACLSRARAAIGDRDGAAPMIKTFARYGYRFVGKVRIKARVDGGDHEPTPRRAVLPSPPLAQVGAPSGFCGRGVELAMLADTLNGALAGRGGLVFVTGMVGIGKTRLGDELARLATARGVLALSGRCDETEQPPPFWPWAQALRAYLAQHDTRTIRAALGSGAADVAQIAPALRERFPQLAERGAADPEHLQVRVLEGLRAFVRRAAEARPLLAILDDLQWADAASLRLLDALGREMHGTRVLIVGIYGDVVVDPPIARLVAAHAAAGMGTRLQLAGIDADAVQQLLDHACGQTVPDAFAAAVAELTDGNPLFVLEMVRHLTDLDLLSPAQARWPTRDAIERAGVSSATCAIVGRRLRSLSSACQRALAAAAVAGMEFNFGLVESVLTGAGDDALRSIEEAHAAGIVLPADGNGQRYRFAHRCVRAVIYQGINPTRRARLHAAIVGQPAGGLIA